MHIPEEGLALRGTFVINPEGIIKTAEVHSNEIARDVKETLRKVKAAKYTAEHPGEVCPAKWNDGAYDHHPVAGPGRQDLKTPRSLALPAPEGPAASGPAEPVPPLP